MWWPDQPSPSALPGNLRHAARNGLRQTPAATSLGWHHAPRPHRLRSHLPLRPALTAGPRRHSPGSNHTTRRNGRARTSFADGIWHVPVRPGSRSCGARAGWPVEWKKWVGAAARAPRMRGVPRLPGVGRHASGKCISRALDGFVLFGFSGPNPSFSGAPRGDCRKRRIQAVSGRRLPW
jgi:hypothetical protein